MKKIIVLMIIFLVSGTGFLARGTIGTPGTVGTIEAWPFYGKTKHKPVKRMTRRQVRAAQKGKSFYVNKSGKVKRNR